MGVIVGQHLFGCQDRGDGVMIYKQINAGHLDAVITIPMQFVLIA